MKGRVWERYLLVHTRVEHFRPNKKREIVYTDEEENLVASSIERSIVVPVELRSPLARFPLESNVEAVAEHKEESVHSER